MLVDVLLVVGDDGFGNGLADGVDLRGVTTTGDADADVDISCPCCQYSCSPSLLGVERRVRTELVNTEDQDGLVNLESQDLGLDLGKRLSVNLDETLSGLEISRKYHVRFRGIACVPCSGRQLLAILLAFVILLIVCLAVGYPYQSRSSSCRSIARSGRPCWATVGCACG